MIELIIQWWETSLEMPVDQLASTVVFWLAPFIVFAILMWGFLELWIYHRQNKYDASLKYTLLQISVPKDAIQTPKGVENFFSILAGAKSTPTFYEKWIQGKFNATFSFEIASIGGRVSFYIRAVDKYRDMIEAAMYAEYPEAQIIEIDDYTKDFPTDYPNDDWDMWGSEVALKKPNFLPLKTYVDFEHQGEKDQRFKDPLLGIIEAMGAMKEGEFLCFQMLITPLDSQDDWVKEGIKFIDKTFGKPEKSKPKGIISETIGWIPGSLLEQGVGIAPGAKDESKQDDFRAFKITPLEKDQLDGVSRKISKIGWKAKIRFIYISKKEVFRKGAVASMMKGLFQQYTHQSLNSFGLIGSATPSDDYIWQEWEMPTKQRNLVNRFKSRSIGGGGDAKIMNVEELATFWHFPAADARTPVLTSIEARRAEAPVELNFALEGAELIPNLQVTESGPTISTSGTGSLPPRKPLAVPRPKITPSGQQANRGADPAFSNMVPIQPRKIQPITPINSSDSSSSTKEPAEKKIHLPVFDEDQKYMPQPGKPAPLPPGLDLNSQEIKGSLPEDMSNR